MKEISRREFIRISALAAAGAAAAACAKTAEPEVEPTKAPDQVAPTATPVPVEEPAAKESPMLVDMVAAGSLSPLEERLPQNPLVVEPRDSIGTFGGQWTTGTIETNGNDMIRNIGYEGLVRWTPAWDGVINNVAESYSANDEATEFTFVLRQGMRWSDGEPFTADDIVFYRDDILYNKDITPNEPRIPFVVEKINDFTVKWVFETPQGLFIKQMARVGEANRAEYAKHYLKQFHGEYNDKVDELVQQSGEATWADLVGAMATKHQNVDLPLLWAWTRNVGLGETTTRVTADRNAFYWKVDPEGNQYPYIDQFNHELVANNEVLVLKCLNGEIDFQEQWINDPKNQPVFFDGQEKGGYHFWETSPTYVNECVIMLNRDCTDPVYAEMSANKDFRIGLSHAMNRQELIDVVLVGQSAPHQAAPRPESVYYHERLAKQYTEYDLDKANEHLDKAGYTERDDEGFRLGPDGKRISYIFEIDQGRVAYVDLLELIKPMWAEVGIEMNMKLMERSLWEERTRRRDLEFHASAHKFGGGGGEAPILDPRYWFPNGIGGSLYAKSWAEWYNNPEGEIAKEPPDEVKAMMDLYGEISLTADEVEQTELLAQLLDMAADQFWAIGTVLEPLSFGIATNRLQNTPETLPRSWIYPTPVPCNTFTFYIDEG